MAYVRAPKELAQSRQRDELGVNVSGRWVVIYVFGIHAAQSSFAQNNLAKLIFFSYTVALEN